MAYIYRYQLRNIKLRKITYLVEYAQIIQAVLNDHFDKNLKDSFVEADYFEFTLYASVSRKLLQEMGRKLKIELPIRIERYGFVRMEQTLYAIVYSSQDNQDDVHIEFIDSTLLNNPELFAKRARLFFEKTSNNNLFERSYIDSAAGFINSYYIDVLDSYADRNSMWKFFGDMDNISCFFVKGYHRRYNDGQIAREEHAGNIFLLEKGFDAGYVENREKIIRQEDDKIDYLELYSSQKQNSRQIKEITEKLNLILNTTEYIDSLNSLKENCTGDKRINYKFRVYNVGQAQAVSLAINDEPPFLYFDYGMPYGRNLHTRPPQVNILTNPGITIILSHVHKDHWFRIADDFAAFQCNWFIPDQPRGVQLNHVIAEIIIHGGSVSIINSDIAFGQGRLTCGGVSKITPSRCASHVHETGLSLHLKAHDTEGNELNILVAGDQRYDYINASQLSNLDLLVASHHGGDYCWSSSRHVPKARPLPSSTVIYSYGTNNTYWHPSNQADYIAANWAQAYHTTSGDYDTNLFL